MEDRMTGHNRQKRYECDVCGKAWQHLSQLEIHRWVQMGEHPFNCSECDKNFTRYETLVWHNHLHSSETPFGCSDCGKNSNSLLEHQRTRTASTPSQSGKGFTHSSKLLAHQQVHTGDRPFLRPFDCSECSKNFNTAYELKAHRRLVEAACSLVAWKKN